MGGSGASAANTPGDGGRYNRARSEAQKAERSNSPGSGRYRDPNYSQQQGQSYYQQRSHSTASYGDYQYQSGNDQLMKFGLGTFGAIVLGTFIAADVMARDGGGEKQLTASTYHGYNQKGMVASVANEFRVDAMRSVAHGTSSNYSPQISKQNYAASNDVKLIIGNSEKQTGGTKTRPEFESQFKNKNKEQASILKAEKLKKEKEERLKHIEDNKIEKI